MSKPLIPAGTGRTQGFYTGWSISVVANGPIINELADKSGMLIGGHSGRVASARGLTVAKSVMGIITSSCHMAY